MSEIDVRVKRLEDDGKETRADLKTLLRDLAEIKASMVTKAELAEVKVAVAKLETRVDKLPTLAKMGVLATITVAAITVVTRWSEIATGLGWIPPTP